MPVRRLALFALCFALAASAHTNGPSRGTHITVAKKASNIGDYEAMYETVQAAVNAAKPGQIIEILDEGVYEEQVVIDGRENHPWRGANAVKGKGGGNVTIVGGKTDITLKYVPVSAAGAKPVIKWHDMQNVSPKNVTEAETPGDTLGSSGNFETNGALRIIRTERINIEGLIVDGDGSEPWVYPNIWRENGQPKYPHTYGNAAIAVAISGSVSIRDCETRNAFLGIAVKDRNTGGVFANINPSDNDTVLNIPLSDFQKTGNHLFEYNKIHSNDVGVYFESSWDLGSTVRYNLIYNNYHGSAKPHSGKPTDAGDQDYASGAIKFKDNYLSPVAIYNNTLFDNEAYLVGAWQSGAQHLVFNNIFARKRGATRQNVIDGKFPYRMKYNTFGGATNIQFMDPRNIPTVARACGHVDYGTRHITQAQMDGMGNIPETPMRFETCDTTCRVQQMWDPVKQVNYDTTICQYQYQTQTQNVRIHGSVLSGPALNAQNGEYPFPSDANNRWLEMAGAGTGSNSLPSLFKSITPGDANFLVPDWDREEVDKYIRNGGWPDAGVLNEDGTIADLGAIPYSGKRPGDGIAQKSRTRVSPFEVVFIDRDATGYFATVSIRVNQEVGTLSGLKIKYLSWIAPVPDNKDSDANKIKIIPSTSIHVIDDASSLSVGTQIVKFRLPSMNAVPDYGFFEIVLEGTGADGKKVNSDVGFLPYRQLEYKLEFKVTSPATKASDGRPMVTAGTPVTIVVTATKKDGAQYTLATGKPLNTAYSLIEPASRIWRTLTPLGNPLTEDNLYDGSKYQRTYTVYFTKAGDEVVSGSGILMVNSEQSLVFRGNLQILVRPGAPDKVIFVEPIPKSQLGNATPPTISGTYEVSVQVTDRYDNPIDTKTPVTVVSSDAGKGTIDMPQTVSTDTADGIVRFTARVTNGAPSDRFDLYASISQTGASKAKDTASLRVGRATDGLRVFYHESAPPKLGSAAGGNRGGHWLEDYDEKEEISALVGALQPVWVKLVSNAGDTVMTSKSGSVCVTPSEGLLLYRTEGGSPEAGPLVIDMTEGQLKFWVTSNADISGASVSVSAKMSADCGAVKDNGINDGSRGGISFFKPDGNILDATVTADNGYARPDYVEIRFQADENGGSFEGSGSGTETWKVPTKVSLRWPSEECALAKEHEASGGAVSVLDATTIGVTFPPSAFPAGYSDFSANGGNGMGLLKVYGAIDGKDELYVKLIEGIGPLIVETVSADRSCAGAMNGPVFYENPGHTAPDVLTLRITEDLTGGRQALLDNSLLISGDSAGTPRELSVAEADLASSGLYTLTLSATDTLRNGDWIKLNPAHGILDGRNNPVHGDNRWVQIRETEVPPEILDAWYVTRDETGKADTAYIVFSKAVSTAAEWFAGGSIAFDWPNGGVSETFAINSETVGAIRIVDGNTIAIDLNTAFKKASAPEPAGVIVTGGVIRIDVAYGTAKGWAADTKYAADRARPVLMGAVLQIGSMDDAGTPQPDTLIITYSETMNANMSGILSPVSILSRADDPNTGSWRPVSLEFLGVASDGVTYKYAVADSNSIKTRAGAPASGDWVKINDGAGVSDNVTPANAQTNPNNRRVALEVRAGGIRWQTKIKNNPFRDSTVVVMTPNFKGGERSFTAQIRLYDNMGKIVVDDTTQNNPGDPVKGNALEWVWNGRNKQGRVVGTGTYLFKVVCFPVPTAADPSPERYMPPPAKIAFVRGKK